MRRLPALASQCAVCRSWPAAPVCPPCIARFSISPARCTRCALPLPARLHTAAAEPSCCAECLQRPPPFDAALAAVPYAYPWSLLITRYKFGGQPAWADLFAVLLMQAPGVTALLGGLQRQDWLLPVPLSAERLGERGFNQSWELAKALARHSAGSVTTDARLLQRIRHTRPQSQLKRSERLANVRGAFLVDPLRAGEMRGRRVVLVDDVMTSGASMVAAAQALKEAGAAHVTALVLARTA